MARKTILVIDDDADLRVAVAEELETEGFATLEAPTAVEGVKAAHDEKPDLILLDIDFPTWTGARPVARCAARASPCRSSC